jgi:plastocyanin
MKNLLLSCLLLISISIQSQTIHDISTIGNSFSPANITIQAGDMVRWTNTSMGFHNVRSLNPVFRCANGCDGNGGNGNPATNAWTFMLTFNTPGSFLYYCEIHGNSSGGGMAGTITVQAAPPDCTTLSSPVNGATNVSTATALTWIVAAGSPTGYRLDAGITQGGTEILDNFDVGNVTTFNPDGVFPNNGTIFITIRPYNAGGEADGCAEELFQTEFCSPNLMIQNMTFETGEYRSDGDLNATNATVENGTTVLITSDSGVVLQQNFTVEAGSVLDANILDCTNTLSNGNAENIAPDKKEQK